MKRLSIILYFLLYTVAISYSQENLSNWDYPIKPGSEKWKSFTTSTQKNKAIEIPDSVLKAMPTSKLAEVCFNYPRFIDCFLVNNPDLFIQSLLSDFNGLKELLQRKDGANELVKIYNDYQTVNNILINKRKRINNQYPLVRIGFIELLLANDSIQKRISPEDIETLRNKCEYIYTEKRKSTRNYGLASLKMPIQLLDKTQNATKLQKSLVLSRERLDQVQTITELDQIFEDVKNNH